MIPKKHQYQFFYIKILQKLFIKNEIYFFYEHLIADAIFSQFLNSLFRMYCLKKSINSRNS
jgi:hypothetical protein